MHWSPLEFALGTQGMKNTLEKVMNNHQFLEVIGTVLNKFQVGQA